MTSSPRHHHLVTISHPWNNPGNPRGCVNDDPAGTAFDVFLSYHSGDADWVVALKAALASRDVRVWLDRDEIRPGDRFVTVLEDALRSVGCVVFVVSPGSLRSSWVQEEYHRALTLANTVAPSLRLIAVLIGDAEPPGFLASRDWVDFRDATLFNQRLDELVFGICGRRELPQGSGAATGFQRGGLTPAAAGVDEVACLARAIARARDEGRRLRRNRLLGAIPGLLISGGYAMAASDGAGTMLPVVLLGAPVVTALVAWGATAPSVARCDRKLEQFELLHDGLAACRDRTIPGCTRLRETFWNMLQRQTSGLAEGPQA